MEWCGEHPDFPAWAGLTPQPSVYEVAERVAKAAALEGVITLFGTPMPQTFSPSADDWRALFEATLHGSRNSGPGDSEA